jgi:iron complex outermembrane receptor protein
MNKCGKPNLTFRLLMRISVLQLLLAGGLVISASAKNVHGQGILDRKISLSEKGQGLKKVLHSIAQIADVKFTYDSRLVASRGQVDLEAQNEDLKNVLDRLLSPFSIQYEVVNDQIVLKKGEIKDAATIATAPAAEPQEGVRGKVTSDKDGNPIPGASIVIQGTDKGASTDAEGRFTIDAKAGDVLVISAVGYASIRRTVHTAGEMINVILGVQTGQLTDVVVTALGRNLEARSLGYSDQQVSGTDVTKADPPNLSQGLMGKVAGMDVTVANGVEGGSSRIVIRGNNSLLGNNQPLIVVDGVMIDNNPILPGGANLATQNLLGQNTDVNSNQNTDYGSFLNTVNPDDVESISVLKGPTAAALYGARGANGVILVITKKGSKEKGLGLDYNISERWNDPYRFMKLQHEYGMGMTLALTSANPAFYQNPAGQNREESSNDFYGSREGNVPGGNSWSNYIGYPGDGASWGPKMTGQPITWWDGTTRPYTGNPNIFKSFYRTGNTSTQNVSFSGGGDVGTIRISYTRTGNDAITYNSNFTQNVFNLGSSINVSKKVKVEATASYINISRLNATDLYDEGSNPIGVGYQTDYNLPMDYKPIERALAINGNGSRNQNVISNFPSQDNAGSANYWWATLTNNNRFTQNQLLGNVKLSADILPWLNATAHTGIDYFTNQFQNEAYPYDSAGLDGTYSDDLATNTVVNIDGMLTAHKDNLFKDINASLSLGASYYYNNVYDLNANNPGPFAVPYTFNLSNYTSNSGTIDNHLPSENRIESEINSTYGILNLSYKNYLFLEASGRNDWSSTLPSDKWSFFYPSANLSFVFTDAFNMGGIKKWLSYGKVRLADAASANGYIPYQTAFTYSEQTFGGVGAVTVPSTLPSVGIQPQRSRSFETGTDLGFFNNRLNVNFTYYNIYSYDQILPISIPASTGSNALTINTGALRNQGIEFTIGAKVVKTRDFSWDIMVNGARNSNKVVALSPGLDQIPIGSWFGSDGVSMNARVGDQYGTIYGLDYQYLKGQKVVNLLYGDGPNTGNGPVIGAQYATTPDLVKIGNATPKLTGGIGNTFTYKNFSLYVLTDFKIGGQIWSGDYESIMGQGMAPETTWERDGHGLPFTFPDGTKANVGVILPGVTPTGETNTAVVNSWWKYAGNYQSWTDVPLVRSNGIFTDSWGKLRELSLTYRLPASVIRASKIFQNLSVSLIGRDLFYLFTTLPDRLNPEGLMGTTNVQGFQFGELPGVRSFGFSVKAGF